MALPTASDNPFPSVLVTEGSAPSSPASGKQRVYIDSADHHLKRKNSSGTVTDLESGAGAISVGVVGNEVMNFPSLEKADGAQPSWWTKAANCTLTEEDIAGEGITERWARTLKVVTTADSYADQRYTYADQKRLKSGSVASCRVAVWSVSGVTARVRLQDSNGSLGVATSTAASWTILTVEGVTLTGTWVELRLEVNNGTAYFVPLSLGVGATAPSELGPRRLDFRWVDPTLAVSLNSLGNPNSWTDVDVTSGTSNLAAMVQLQAQVLGVSGSSWDLNLRRKGSSDTAGADNLLISTSSNSYVRPTNSRVILLDDARTFQYLLNRWQGSGTISDGQINIWGWWEWS